MKFVQSTSIKTKLILMIMSTTVLALLIVGVTIIVIDQRTVRKAMIERLDTLSRVIADRSTAALSFDDQYTAKQMLSALNKDHSILVACMYSSSDKLFAIYSVAGAAECRTNIQQDSILFEEDHVYLSHSILLKGKTIGTLYITATQKEIDEQLLWFALTIMILILLSSMVAYYLATKLQLYFTMPLIKLKDVTEHIANEGDYSQKILAHDTADEIGTLYQSFSKMIEQIQFREEALKQSEERFTFAMQGANDGLWDWDLKTDEVYYSPRWKSMLGYTEDEVKPHLSEWERLLHTDDKDMVLSEVEACVNGKNKKFEVEFRLQHKDGHYVDVLSRAFPVRHKKGEVIRLVGTHVDITERKQADQELRKSHALYSQAEKMGKLGHWEWNVLTDQLIACSEQYANIFDMSVEEIFDSLQSREKELDEFVHKEDHELYSQVTNLAYERKEGWDIEYRATSRTGKIVYVHEVGEPVLDEHGTLIRTFGTLQDISERKQTEEKLSFQASHDALTGLINRYEFERRAERLLSTVKQDKSEHALCFMDLDQFKVINDTCGHIAGDEMLRQLGSELQGVVRHRDTLARLGGDEFGVLMEHCSLDDAHRVAVSLQKTIQDYQLSWEGRNFRVGVSIGLVSITESTTNLIELLKDADAACYMAKDKGRNRVHVYHTDDAEISKRHGEMQWVTRLNHALNEDRFFLYAQSIVPLDGSSKQHYELLIRMVDETGNIIPPGAFLPSAERYNLISKIDRWVIEKAFGLLADNPAFLEQINFCSINLSGQSITEKDFLDFIITQLDESGVQGEKICFEITETAAISNLNTANLFITEMKVLGCRFALDDFGSGLSSFGYLKNMDVDYLKIDGMFVKDIVDDPIDHAMVKSINEIGHVMGMQTIAEFVENDEIKGMLKEIGVNYAQGYGIDKPQPFDELLSRSNNVTNIK